MLAVSGYMLKSILHFDHQFGLAKDLQILKFSKIVEAEAINRNISCYTSRTFLYLNR